MTASTLVYSITLFAGLFILGTLLCLRLYKWDYARYFTSNLWVKTYYWIPIFIIFLTMLYIQLWAAVLITVGVISFGVREVLRITTRDWVSWLYMFGVAFAISHLVLFFITANSQQSVNILLVIVFSSVLSDVTAYFSGNFIGRHKLPTWINKNKSWEGVSGQLVGAVIGFYLIAPVIYPAPHIAFAILIGIASSIGDIANSIVKRRAKIKDWGMTIPGHGGVLDRFASLAFAIATGYWWMLLA